ncbi:MAG: class I SAM-dependent methyltransferase [bacterium]|nr:class I SAM-dependent methyltransferase [Candidatus Sumerlaeota bacterium]
MEYWNVGHGAMYEDFCFRFVSARGGTILDAGCGLGFFLKHMADYPAWECHGCELSTVAVEYAQSHLGLNNIQNTTIEKASFKPNSFDIITLWDVIEHIPSPDSLLTGLSKLLNAKGFLFIHTPNAAIQIHKARMKKLFFGMRPETHYLEARDHCHIYTPTSMRLLVKRNGFSDIRFTHLRPIQSIAGRGGMPRTFAKTLWHHASIMLDRLSKGRINMDNLFVIARKSNA